MKSEIFMIMGGLAIFAIVLSLFIQMQAGQDVKKNADTNKLSILGEDDENKPDTSMESETKTPPPMTIDTEQDYKAVLETSEGTITIDLNESKTPITVNNFVYLARTGFYDGTVFHRVIEDFMIQGGDPEGTGAGGPGYKFDDEPFEGEYTRGTVAMANAGPNTNGSQFFIMHGDSPLPKDYVIFGSVTEGLDVVDTIATAKVVTSRSGEKSKPVTPVIVNKVTITESEKIEEAPVPTETETPTPSAETSPTETPSPTNTPTP